MGLDEMAFRNRVRLSDRLRLTPFRHRRYDSLQGGPSISADDRNVYDFERLERAVAALADECRVQRGLNAQLRGEVDTQRRRIRSLEGQLLGANQKRQDVAKRIDELIAQIDHLDGEFDGARL
jgi:septal ring factor EnvC (AmiA/AmiB activator)